MIVKYISFLIGVIWSYSLIKTQSIFSKKAGLIFKVFISNVSWLTLIAAIYFGYKNFSIKFILVGVIFSIVLVHLGFKFLGKFLASKFSEKQLIMTKTFFEYSLIKTQSIFSKKAGLIFKVFISNVSWLTLIAAIYFGYKNFSIKFILVGVIFSIILVHLGFKFLGKFLASKFTEKQLIMSKTFFEYSLIVWVIYYLFY